MTDVPYLLRLARPDELRAIVAIDDAASELYADAGLHLALGPDHPFVVDESVRWARAIANGLAHVAVDAGDRLVGFMTLGLVDDAPYLDQLAVHPHAMRRGIGRALMQRAFAWSGARALWLTTYAHLPWNQPYYERHGFVVVPEAACGPQMKRILASQRAALPEPDSRVAMVRSPSSLLPRQSVSEMMNRHA